ncbi:MAG: LEA type 2 family protein [Betaproteobacteria bacterium]|nr:LEA type 2 family protein [Betaproteobacteria bacterium]
MNAGRRAMWAALVASAILQLQGCSALPGGREPVSVTVSDLRLGAAGVLEQQYFVTLRVQNPNDREIRLKGVVFDLELNGKSFAKGTGPADVTVPRFGSEVIEVETVSTLTSVLRQLGGVTDTSGPLRSFSYRIRGRLHQAGVGGPIAFDEKGELNLSANPGGTSK